MPPLAIAAEYVTFGLLGLLAATVVIHLLTGGINLRGVMRVKGPHSAAEMSPARAQMLIVTLAVAAAWLGRVMESTDGTLPDVPGAWLGILGLSHGSYVVSKVRQMVPVREIVRSFFTSEGP